MCDSVPVWVRVWWSGCEELGWVLLGGRRMEVCVMGICGGESGHVDCIRCRE